MAKTGYLTARIEPNLKQEAESILKSVGLTSSQMINLIYRQVVINKGVPLELRTPNAYVQETVRDAESNPENLSHYENFADLMQELTIK